MNPPTHAQIAERAHQLWLAEGCPEGRQEEHWRVAERALRSSSGTAPEGNSNEKGRIAAPTPDRVAVAAAESADENLMSPPPSDDAAIKAALPDAGKPRPDADKPAVLVAANQPPASKSRSPRDATTRR